MKRLILILFMLVATSKEVRMPDTSTGYGAAQAWASQYGPKPKPVQGPPKLPVQGPPKLPMQGPPKPPKKSLGGGGPSPLFPAWDPFAPQNVFNPLLDPAGAALGGIRPLAGPPKPRSPFTLPGNPFPTWSPWVTPDRVPGPQFSPRVFGPPKPRVQGPPAATFAPPALAPVMSGSDFFPLREGDAEGTFAGSLPPASPFVYTPPPPPVNSGGASPFASHYGGWGGGGVGGYDGGGYGGYVPNWAWNLINWNTD